MFRGLSRKIMKFEQVFGNCFNCNSKYLYFQTLKNSDCFKLSCLRLPNICRAWIKVFICSKREFITKHFYLNILYLILIGAILSPFALFLRRSITNMKWLNHLFRDIQNTHGGFTFTVHLLIFKLSYWIKYIIHCLNMYI